MSESMEIARAFARGNMRDDVQVEFSVGEVREIVEYIDEAKRYWAMEFEDCTRLWHIAEHRRQRLMQLEKDIREGNCKN